MIRTGVFATILMVCCAISLKIDFQGSRVTSDGVLILVRELDERLGVGDLIAQHLNEYPTTFDLVYSYSKVAECPRMGTCE